MEQLRGGAARHRGSAMPILVSSFALAFLLATGAAAQEVGGPSASLGGSVDTQPILSWKGASEGLGSLGYGSTTTLFMNLDARGPRGPVQARAGVSLEASILSGVAASVAYQLAQAGYGADGFLAPDISDPGLAVAPEAVAGLRLRTAWARLDWGWGWATLGRQVLNYGRGAVWSPVDIFASLETNGLSASRKGIDAVRVTAALGDTGLADLVAAPRADPSQGSYALRFSGLLAQGLDAGLIGAWEGGSESWLGGADVKLDVGPGIYGEVLCILPRNGGGASFRAAGGADWSVGDLVLAAEYYWNGGLAPALDPWRAGAHNAYASLSWSVSDFTRLASQFSWDLSDSTWKALLASWFDLAQNSSLALYASCARSGGGASDWAAEFGADLTVKF
jgi:hypothetical protein